MVCVINLTVKERVAVEWIRRRTSGLGGYLSFEISDHFDWITDLLARSVILRLVLRSSFELKTGKVK